MYEAYLTRASEIAPVPTHLVMVLACSYTRDFLLFDCIMPCAGQLGEKEGRVTSSIPVDSRDEHMGNKSNRDKF